MQNIELLSLLYELSLTNIRHSKPEDVARQFLKKLLSRKALNYGAVWIIDDIDNNRMAVKSLFSMPRIHEKASINTSQFRQVFKEKDLAILEKSLLNEEMPEGTYGYFKLSNFGLLELYEKVGKNKLNQSSLYPFTDVVNQFSFSLQSGFSYKQLQDQILQREKAEISLTFNEEKYRRIIDNIHLGLLEVDTDEVVQFANEPFLDLVKYNLEDIVGKNASDLFLDDEDADYKKRIANQNENRISGKSDSYEMRIRDREGIKKWVIISGAPNYDKNGQLVGSIGIHLDISREKALKEENEFKDLQLTKLIESSLDALISIDERGKIFEWSPQAEAIFGFTADEISGKLLSDTVIPHQHRDAHQSGMKNFLVTGEGPVLNHRIEITALRKSGEEFPIELTIFPLKHLDKYYFTAFVRDITELKKSRENMERSLQRQKELNEMKSKFISMTSHELRTPLTTVRSNTELLQYQLENSDDIKKEELRKYIQRIETNVDRLNQLINNILIIGQLDSRKLPFNPKATDVFILIQDHILPDFQSRAGSIKCSKEGHLFPVTIDKRLFTHIMANLLENAIKYSHAKKSPEINLKFQSDHLLIQVTDYGMGIPEKDQKHLFDTFYRASNVGNIQGTGLGLSIVHEFVKIHGGKIKVESEVGKGTTFNLFFPKN